jgi:hypothetical protein
MCINEIHSKTSVSEQGTDRMSTPKKNDDEEEVIERCTMHKEVISVK